MASHSEEGDGESGGSREVGGGGGSPASVLGLMVTQGIQMTDSGYLQGWPARMSKCFVMRKERNRLS